MSCLYHCLVGLGYIFNHWHFVCLVYHRVCHHVIGYVLYVVFIHGMSIYHCHGMFRMYVVFIHVMSIYHCHEVDLACHWVCFVCRDYRCHVYLSLDHHWHVLSIYHWQAYGIGIEYVVCSSLALVGYVMSVLGMGCVLSIIA
jgi:hypothetical protein